MSVANYLTVARHGWRFAAAGSSRASGTPGPAPEARAAGNYFFWGLPGPARGRGGAHPPNGFLPTKQNQPSLLAGQAAESQQTFSNPRRSYVELVDPPESGT